MGKPICERMCHNWLFYMNSAHPVYNRSRFESWHPQKGKRFTASETPFLFLYKAPSNNKSHLYTNGRETGAAVNPQFPTKPSNLTRKRQTFILNIIFGHSLNPLFYAGSSAIGPYYVNKFLHILQTVVCTPQIAHILKLLQGTQRMVDLIKLTRI